MRGFLQFDQKCQQTTFELVNGKIKQPIFTYKPLFSSDRKHYIFSNMNISLNFTGNGLLKSVGVCLTFAGDISLLVFALAIAGLFLLAITNRSMKNFQEMDIVYTISQSLSL